jgi:hypothetical protein
VVRGGGVLVVVALDPAVRTFVLPRGAVVVSTSVVFLLMRRPFARVATSEPTRTGGLTR